MMENMIFTISGMTNPLQGALMTPNAVALKTLFPANDAPLTLELLEGLTGKLTPLKKCFETLQQQHFCSEKQ